MADSFGVVVTCCVGDYMFAKGCCASIRHFMGDVPLCLLVDGEFPLENMPELYGAKVIRRRDVKTPFLQAKSYGWGITKMIALWESPFERFLLLDADTIVWGDLRKLAAYDKYDVILNDHGAWPEAEVSKWFFKPEGIRRHFPSFNSGLRGYANTGVMFMSRGIFDIAEYEEILDFAQSHPDLFFPGEQGFLNFMLFRARDAGRIRLGNAILQYIVPDHAMEESKAKFSFSNGTPSIVGAPVVLHWCGLKPFIRRKVPTYSEPMTFFRKRFLSDLGIKSDAEIECLLLREEKRLETRQLIGRWRAQFKNTLKSAFATLRGDQTRPSPQ